MDATHIYDKLTGISNTLDQAQTRLIEHRELLVHINNNARLAQKWKKDFVGAISSIGIERDEIVKALVAIQKLKDEAMEERRGR